MICGYCGSRNADGEHRCGRCGRKPGDTLTAAASLHLTEGALAAAVRPRPEAPRRDGQQVRRAADLSQAVQGSLFQQRPAPNVIPFAAYAPPAPRPQPRPGAGSVEKGASRAPAKTVSRQPERRPSASGPEGQGRLEFLPAEPAAPRTLPTTVEAVIYCDAPVATALHRAFAAALDGSMVFIGYGIFLLAFYLAGGEFVLNRQNALFFGAGLPLLGFAYGAMWTVAGTETAGMRWMRLHLISFEGFPLDRRQRVLRFAGSCLSFGTLGLGLLWSLADEENLTWQDHISRTFPTPQQPD